jgi:3',5'-cyclic AMP phosphodiesterase CpdA
MGLTVRKTLITSGILLLLVGSTSGYPDTNILIGPYPQHAQDNSIVVSWKTTTPTTHNEVHWGSTPSLGNVSKEKNICGKTFHTVKIEGLSAGQKYYYVVVSDTSESPLYSFWTASEQEDPIRFTVYGDSQGDWDDWQTVRVVAKAIENAEPMFVLKTGDLVDDGKNPDDWIEYFTASSFLHNSTLYPVLGNHENNSCLFFCLFFLPFNEHWYSFDNGPVHFIGLDSNMPARYRLGQYLWLLHDLKTTHQSYTMVYFHHPVYSSSEHGNTTLLQKIWAPLFERFHVDIVFNGHDHDYERSIVNNVTYIVTGGGGSPLYDNGQNPCTVYSEKTYHFCLLTVNSSRVTFEAKKPDGSVFDSFHLLRH